MFTFMHGRIDPAKLLAYCVIYNEMYYLPAFLDHYRALGVEQFVFIDDHSTDETLSFLTSQPDTVILRPQMRYGDMLNGKRAGPQWKWIFAQEHLQGRWALCVDADEFLVLDSLHLADLIAQADARGDVALGAVMVDMYSASAEEMDIADQPQSFAAMLRSYGCFDQGPYIEWHQGALRPQIFSEGAGGRLLRQQGISPSDYASALMRLVRYFTKRKKRSVFKVPLVKWRAGFRYLDAHTLNCAPSAVDGLALLHFKFTGALRQKVTWAMERKSYSKGSGMYFAIDAMLSSMDDTPEGFTYEGTRHFSSYRDLEAARIVPFQSR